VVQFSQPAEAKARCCHSPVLASLGAGFGGQVVMRGKWDFSEALPTTKLSSWESSNEMSEDGKGL